MLLQKHLEYRLRTLNDQKTSTINGNQTGGKASCILGKIGMLQRQNPTENKGGMMRFHSQTTQFAVYLPDSWPEEDGQRRDETLHCLIPWRFDHLSSSLRVKAW